MNGLHLHRHNRVETLLGQLGDVISTPLAHPLAAEVVVVDSPGMERWLSMQLAQRFGVCANMAWSKPHTLVEQLYLDVLGYDEKTSTAWRPDRLVWPVMEVLRTCATEPEFHALARYLSPRDAHHTPGDGEALSPRAAFDALSPRAALDARRLGVLGGKLASLLSRYATWRFDMVARWDAGGELPEEQWQAALYRRVAARASGPSPAVLHRELIDALRSQQATVPARVCVFGVSALPPTVLEVLRALAAHSPVHLFTLQPTLGGWDGHPLLRSLGRIGREYDQLLGTQADPAFEEPLDPAAPTMLSVLQSDLLHGRVRDTRVVVPDTDNSVVIHRSDGPLRQLEVLRDELLRLFADDEGLEPRDVVVFCPDISTYAPLIEAVFDDGATAKDWKEICAGRRDPEPGFPRIRFRIADLSLRERNPLADILLDVLAMPRSRMTATQVVDLLYRQPVRDRFKLSLDELERIRQWVGDAHLHWGTDAAHRALYGRPEVEEHTWRHGLDRLLVGVAIAGDDQRVWEGLMPVARLEGGATVTLGKFVEFAETLLAHLEDLDRPRSRTAWYHDLSKLLADLTHVGEKRAWLRLRLEQALAELFEVDLASQEAPANRGEPAVALATVEALLGGRFDHVKSSPAFLAGAVTFCTFMPMRSIPFRVVAMVGMDDGAFPRKSSALGFDRMARQRQVGDRGPRDDDRYLFLETLLAARERLIITYAARDPNDNKPRPPAVPVGDLVDILRASCTTASGSLSLEVSHPLQPFSPRVFQGSRPGFDLRALAAARASQLEPTPPAPFFIAPFADDESDDETVIQLHDLVNFFDSPTKHFVKRRLRLSLDEGLAKLADDEGFSLAKGLEEWKVGDLYVRQLFDGAQVGDAERASHASGQLPLGLPGRLDLDRVGDSARSIHAAAAPLLHGDRGSISIDGVVGGVRIVGRVPDVLPNFRLVMMYSKLSAKHVLRAWINHLAMCALGSDGPGVTVVVGRGATDAAVAHFARPESPHAHLEALIDIYVRGKLAPLPFVPSASEKYATGEDLERAAGDWAWDYDVKDCAATQLVFGGSDPVTTPPAWVTDGYTFADLATRVFAPLMAAKRAGAP